MRRRLTWLPLALFSGVLAVALLNLHSPADRTVRSRLVGQSLPSLITPALLPGKPGVMLAATRAEPRVINVFASWCVPCAVEAPQLMELKRRGIRIDGLAIRDTPEAVRAFLARYGDPYAAIGDDRGARAQLALGSSGVPESFVIGGDGRIVLQHVGDIRAENLAEIAAAVQGAR